MPLTKSQKLTFATFLRDNKSELFGAFSSQVTKDTKRDKWNEIFSNLKANGSDVRDVGTLKKDVWGYMRSSVMKKVENSKKTGAGGSELSDLDNIILDVIGKDSTYLNGLGQDDQPPSFSQLNRSEENKTQICQPASQGTSRSFGIPSFLKESVTLLAPTQKAINEVGVKLDCDSDDEGATSFQDTGKQKSKASKGSQLVRKRKKDVDCNIWSDEKYKDLKLQKMTKDLEEQQAKIELLKQQKKESSAREILFQKMGAYYERAKPEVSNQPYNIFLNEF